MNSLRGAAGLEAGKWNEDGLPILMVVLAKPADDRRRMRLTLCPLSAHSCRYESGSFRPIPAIGSVRNQAGQTMGAGSAMGPNCKASSRVY
jgi:hypothetical protein